DVAAGRYKVCVETTSMKSGMAGPGAGAGPGPGGPTGSSKGGPPPGVGGPGGPPDLLKAVKSGKIKTGPPEGGGEEKGEKPPEGAPKPVNPFEKMAENAKRYVYIPPHYSKP